METLQEKLVDAITNVIMNQDAFLAVHGKQHLVDRLMNDSQATEEAMIELILSKKDLILEYNPDFDFSLIEDNNE
jgi:hypothetical protein